MEKVTFCVDADPRPTCVLDLLDGDVVGSLHRNEALKQRSHLLEGILDAGALQSWALNAEYCGDVPRAGKAAIYAYTIDKRWRVLQWVAAGTNTQDPLGKDKQSGEDTLSIRSLHEHSGTDLSLSLSPSRSLQENGSVKADPLILNRKLKDALADRDDATGKLFNLLRMMTTIDVGMFEYSVDGVLVYANEAFHTLSGVPPNNNTPMIWADWVFEEDKPWIFEHWIALVKGQPRNFDMRWIGSHPLDEPDGKWVAAACVPTTDDAGNVITVSGCITDISAQRRSHMDAVKKAEALERAAASEKRFANFVTHSNVAFYTFNVNETVFFTTDRFLHYSH